jgi:hypothetical protein
MNGNGARICDHLFQGESKHQDTYFDEKGERCRLCSAYLKTMTETTVEKTVKVSKVPADQEKECATTTAKASRSTKKSGSRAATKTSSA